MPDLLSPAMFCDLALVARGGVYSTPTGRQGGTLGTLLALVRRGLVEAPDVEAMNAGGPARWKLTPEGREALHATAPVVAAAVVLAA